MGKLRGQKALAEIAKGLEAKKQQGKVKTPKPERAVVVPIDTFTAQHGDYVRDGTKLRNRFVTTVERWKAQEVIDDRQYRAIEYCERLWIQAGNPGGLVMDLLKIPGQPGGSGFAQQYALDELTWLKDRIPLKYWDVFENVCRFDKSGAEAGITLANDRTRQADRALLVVKFVADLVASWRRL